MREVILRRITSMQLSTCTAVEVPGAHALALTNVLRIAEQAFGAKFHVYEPDCLPILEAVDEFTQPLANEIGIWIDSVCAARTSRVIPLNRGSAVLIPLATDRDGSMVAAATLSEPPTELLARLASTVHMAMSQRIEIEEQRLRIANYAAQVSRDFEMLVSVQQLARQIQQSQVREPLGETAAALLPCLCDMIRASEVIVIERLDLDLEVGDDSLRQTKVWRSFDTSITSEQIVEFARRHRLQAELDVVVENCETPGGVTQPFPGVDAAVMVALTCRNRTFGWILALRVEDTSSAQEKWMGASETEFGSFEAGILKSAATFLASHAKNTELFAEQEELLVGVVRAMVNTIDAKDSYTCGHSDRVAAIARILARELELDDAEAERIYLAGLLHDIGKIGVPDHILLKAGKLTDAEFELIKKHPVIGYNVLRDLHQISHVLPGVLHHHESVNGMGYPAGLRGEQIPLVARILAVADAFDAMTSNRPYRAGMPFGKAFEILRNRAGIQWDSRVVDALFACREQVEELFHNDTVTQPDQADSTSDAILQAVLISRDV
jgi:HD-GYP domain-containing protein (c-di-GMP phosphodiesterase class II)